MKTDAPDNWYYWPVSWESYPYEGAPDALWQRLTTYSLPTLS